MGKTIIEKIFSEHAGRDVAVNEDILIYPDLTCAYELPAYMERFPAQMKEFGVEKPKHPERVVIGLDHCYPGGTPEEQEIHKITWAFVKKFGYHIIEGEGISHQVIAERFLKPGMIVTHHDGHACLFGALCAALFPLSAGIIEPLAMESLYLTCPPTVRVNFHGALSKGVAARDVQMWMLQQIGPSGAMNACVEMGGDGFASLTMDDRFTIRSCSWEQRQRFVSRTSIHGHICASMGSNGISHTARMPMQFIGKLLTLIWMRSLRCCWHLPSLQMYIALMISLVVRFKRD